MVATRFQLLESRERTSEDQVTLQRSRARAAASLVAALAFVVGPLGAEELAAQAERFEFSEVHMGTEFRIVFYASDAQAADVAVRSTFVALARLDSLFSDYRDDSEIAEVAARAGSGALHVASPELTSLLTEAVRWAERSGGAFDPTVGPLTKLWRWSARRGELPDSSRLHEAKSRVGFEGLRIEPSGGVALMRSGMSLDLGGIAKGFAGDVMLANMAGFGVEAALIDAGGELVAGAPPPGTDGWRVIDSSGAVLLLAHGAVATSGDRYRYLEVDGVKYSHIVDPRTGLGVIDAPTVTVLAPSGTTADVLASALSILDPEKGADLLASVEGARRLESQGAHR